jgi:uncharacterized protein (DUF1697 family)
MKRWIVLLRGINLGARNRVAMPKLRDALGHAGFADVATYLQSGNVVLSADTGEADLVQRCRAVVSERFGLDVGIVVRTEPELAAVVAGNPIPEAVEDPKRYQVTFFARPPDPALVARLEQLVSGSERFAQRGREAYAWHPAGVARSKLWAQLGSSRLGITATSRNWTTVMALREMAASS